MNDLTDFMWEDQYGNFYAPSQMTSHHLFYTIKMIWNHTGPKHLRIEPYKKYRLNPQRFTKDYCRKAIRNLLAELVTRDDWWLYSNQLQLMVKEVRQIEMDRSLAATI